MKTNTTQTLDKATTRPWSIAAYGEPVKWLSIKRGSETIARLEAVDTPLDEEGKANATLIIEAVNSYDGLLAQRQVLQELVAAFDRGAGCGVFMDMINRNARAAINKTCTR